MGPSGPGWLPAADYRLLVVEPIALHEVVRRACVPSVCTFFQRFRGFTPLLPLQQRRLRPSACSICARGVQIARTADCSGTVRTSMRAVAAVTILLLALSETVHAFGGGVPFALDADSCVVDYQPGCAALYLQPHSPEAKAVAWSVYRACSMYNRDLQYLWINHVFLHNH